MSSRARPSAPQRSASSSASARGWIASFPRPAAVSAAASAASAFACSSRAELPGEQAHRLAQVLDAVRALQLAEQPQAAADDPGRADAACELELLAGERERLLAVAERGERARSLRAPRGPDRMGLGRARRLDLDRGRDGLLVAPLGEQQLGPADPPEARTVGRAGAASVRSSAARAPAGSPRSSAREREEPGGVAHLGGHRRPPEDLALDRALERRLGGREVAGPDQGEARPRGRRRRCSGRSGAPGPVADPLPGGEPLGRVAERQHLRCARGEDARVARAAASRPPAPRARARVASAAGPPPTASSSAVSAVSERAPGPVPARPAPARVQARELGRVEHPEEHAEQLDGLERAAQVLARPAAARRRRARPARVDSAGLADEQQHAAEPDRRLGACGRVGQAVVGLAQMPDRRRAADVLGGVTERRARAPRARPAGGGSACARSR